MQLRSVPDLDPDEPVPPDELANTLTHAAGLALSLAGVAGLAGQLVRVETGLAVSLGVYLATLVAVYTASTMSHAVQQPRKKHLWRVWDQGLIYTLIAGTYTPFLWLYLPPGPRGLTLALLWSAAAAGFFVKVVLQRRVNATTTYSYVLLGWLPAVPLMGRVPLECVAWMALGGVIYTAGTVFLKLDSRCRHFHAAWHVFVIAGSVCHYVAIVAYLAVSGNA